MKYVILLTAAAIVMIASSQSGILNVNAISAKDIREHLQGIDEDQILRAFESLKSGGANNQWLQGIDEDQILRAFESLKSGESGSYGYGAGFILILVLFILLVIIGAGFGTSDISGDEERQELSADVQSGGYIPLMTMEP
ncbi:MAG TPA: YjcZ family sporulation protein [Nitrososphaeraceae archaeon]|nr:YjcZ family sporulation protein [Nitrososphaeraceae archaeon]